MRILVIDPGATSTKLGIWQDTALELAQTIPHTKETIDRYDRIVDQEEMRFAAVENLLKDGSYLKSAFDAVVGRGGLLRPVESGTYAVNDAMMKDLRAAMFGEHASNLGALLAYRLAKRFGVKAFIVDPVVVDELQPLARLSGLADIERRSIFHALNQRAVARAVATRLGKSYDEVNLVVAHLGSGISVGVHRNGRVIDVNNALDGDGPFSQERTGGLPVGDVVTLMEKTSMTSAEMLRKVRAEGGIRSYIGDSDLKAIDRRIDEGDDDALKALEGMAYQSAKEIGALATVLKGEVNGIVLTGGGAHCDRLVSFIRSHVSFISPVFVVPGELELQALAEGAKRVLEGKEEAKVY